MTAKILIILAVGCAILAGFHLCDLLGHYFVISKYDLEVALISVLFISSIGLFILAAAKMIVKAIEKKEGP